MNSITAMPLGMQAICPPPFNELSNGFIFEIRRPAVLQDCHFSFWKINDLNFHCVFCAPG